jgi:hypothetical protein
LLRRSLHLTMKKRTRQLYVMSPGLHSGVAFVSWDAGEDPYQRASDYFPEVDQPVEKRQGLQRNWTQAIKHLPKVWNRLVHQPLWRLAAKPVASF